ncbi:MAG: DUF2064 domain-containing protein [Bacteroidota bacterium]
MFSRTAAAEARSKQLVKEKKKNTALLSRLLNRTKRVLHDSKLPIIHINEKEQRGSTFGARITSAVQDVFSQGYDNVIVVGSDCPELPTSLLKRSAKALANGQQVIGADQRGGAYLIGINKKQFRADGFAQLPWQSVNLLSSLRAYLSQNTAAESTALHLCKSVSHPLLCELKTLADLNTWLDLQSLRSILSRQHIFLQLFLAWQNRPQPVDTRIILKVIERVILRVVARRGPPVLG